MRGPGRWPNKPLVITPAAKTIDNPRIIYVPPSIPPDAQRAPDRPAPAKDRLERSNPRFLRSLELPSTAMTKQAAEPGPPSRSPRRATLRLPATDKSRRSLLQRPVQRRAPPPPQALKPVSAIRFEPTPAKRCRRQPQRRAKASKSPDYGAAFA